MDLFDLRPILEEHQRRRMTEAHEERLAASVAFRWIRLVRRTRRTRHSGATSSPHTYRLVAAAILGAEASLRHPDTACDEHHEVA
jgi:hypothetical protein